MIRRSVNTIAVPSPADQWRHLRVRVVVGRRCACRTRSRPTRPRTYTASFTADRRPPTPPGLVGSWALRRRDRHDRTRQLAHRRQRHPRGRPVVDHRRPARRSADLRRRRRPGDRARTATAFDLTTAGTLTAWVRPTATRAWRPGAAQGAAGRPDLRALRQRRDGGTPERQPGHRQHRRVRSTRRRPCPSTPGRHLAADLRRHHDAPVRGRRPRSPRAPSPDRSRRAPVRCGSAATPCGASGSAVDSTRSGVYDRALTAAQVVTDSTTPTTVDSVPPTAPGRACGNRRGVVGVAHLGRLDRQRRDPDLRGAPQRRRAGSARARPPGSPPG